MTDSGFEVEDHVTFAGGEGEITRIEDRDGGGDRHVTPEEPTLVNASFMLFS
jgi:hypothetical protein